jgi:hypothetical protein
VVGEAVEEARRRQADDNEDGAEGEEAMRWRSGGGGGSSARGTRPRLCFRFFFFLLWPGSLEGGRKVREVRGKRKEARVCLGGREDGVVKETKRGRPLLPGAGHVRTFITGSTD